MFFLIHSDNEWLNSYDCFAALAMTMRFNDDGTQGKRAT